MNQDHHQRPPAGRAYTGDTVVMTDQRRTPRPSSRPPLRPPTKQRRIWPYVRTTLLVVLVLVLVGLVVLYLQFRGIAAQLVVPDARLNPPITVPIGGFNVLLVGVDERPNHPEDGIRSDTLIVVHVDTVGRWASMLSIPRDSRVEVRGIGQTKINVAYGQGYAQAATLYREGTTPQQGGMALASETVEQFLALPSHGQRINYVAQINFDGFAAIIDALGGITIDVPKAIVDEEYPTPDYGTMRVEFQPGIQQMDGARALIYARTRHADSDFDRGARQQQVLRAIADTLRARGKVGQLLTMPRLLDGLQGSVTTTIPLAQPDLMVGLGWLISGLSPDDIEQVRISPETAPNYQEDGSDLVWNPDDVRAVVDRFLVLPNEASEAARVQVFNGTGVSGLANRMTIQVEQAGFTVLVAANAPATDVQQTIVYDAHDKPRTSRRLAKLLGAVVRQGAPPDGIVSTADVVVVLGHDLAK